MKVRLPGIIARWIFILCLPVLLLTASIGYAANSLWLYKYGFGEYDVGETTGLTEVELEKAARGLISYFNSGEEYVDIVVEKDGISFDLFTREEKIHMKDVKGLFWLDYWILLGTLVYTLGYAGTGFFLRRGRYRRKLAWSMVAGSGITLALMLALWLGTLLNFDRLFLRFHLFFFTNEFWSAEGYMLQLFPGDFWYDTTIFCATLVVIAAAIIGVAAGGYLIFAGKNLHFQQEVS